MMLTRHMPSGPEVPAVLGTLGRTVGDLIRQEAPDACWISSYDYVEISEAPDDEVAMTVALAVRNASSAQTETYPLTPFDRFAQLDQDVLT